MDPAAVVFDLDYTLVVPDRDRQALLDQATAEAGVRDIDRQEYLDAHGDDLASETRAPIFDALLDEGDPLEVAAAYRDAIEAALVPLPGVEELIGSLRDRYALGVLTDGPARAQYGKLETLGWRDRFDAVVVTGELPAGKPDPRTFAAICDALGVDPREVVFVGDHPRADVEGAAAAGMTAVQVVTDRFEPAEAAAATVDQETVAADLRDLLHSQTRLP
ncbi:HAD family hydrolase [Halobacteriales archaeon Cl-PHB]